MAGLKTWILKNKEKVDDLQQVFCTYPAKKENQHILSVDLDEAFCGNFHTDVILIYCLL